jgi:hypothetical protein
MAASGPGRRRSGPRARPAARPDMLSLSRSYHWAPGHTVARSQAQLEASDHHDRHCTSTTRRLDPEARSGPQEETKRRREEAGLLYASLFNLELKHEKPATITVTVPSSAGLRWHISLRRSPSPSLPPFFGTCKGGGRGSGGFLVTSLSACDGCVAGHERAGCARARGPVGLSSPSPSLTSLRERVRQSGDTPLDDAIRTGRTALADRLRVGAAGGA